MNSDGERRVYSYLPCCPSIENRVYSNHCPREFFSAFPHPLPAHSGMRFFHSNDTRPVVTGEIPPSFLRSCSVNPLIPPVDTTAESKKRMGGMGLADMQYRMRGENYANQYPFIATEASPSPDENSEYSSCDWSKKRIWPVMGFGKLDIRDSDDSYFISLDLPGVTKDCIDVSLRPTSVVVECVRKPIPIFKGKYHYIERPVGKLVRTIQLPALANPDSISCVYVNGVLTMTIQKFKNELEVKKVRVD